MDGIRKFLNHLEAKRKAVIEEIIARLVKHDFEGLDIKKLKGQKNHFRVRKGKIRIQFYFDEANNVVVTDATYRNDNTY